MEPDDTVTEISGYACGDCGSNTWTLNVGHRSDGKTFLIVSCGNKKCVDKKRKELHASPDAQLVWDEFDITGQGHDIMDGYEPDEIN